MPAGANGKLYGAVTTHVVADALKKNGFDIERKRIDLPGLAIKSVGTYKAIIKLYEAQTAEIHVVVKAQIEEKKEEKPAKKDRNFRRNEEVKAEEAKAEQPVTEEAAEPKAE